MSKISLCSRDMQIITANFGQFKLRCQGNWAKFIGGMEVGKILYTICNDISCPVLGDGGGGVKSK